MVNYISVFEDIKVLRNFDDSLCDLAVEVNLPYSISIYILRHESAALPDAVSEGIQKGENTQIPGTSGYSILYILVYLMIPNLCLRGARNPASLPSKVDSCYHCDTNAATVSLDSAFATS